MNNNRTIILPEDELEKHDILKKIATRFEKGRTYKDVEVNDIISSFGMIDIAITKSELIKAKYLLKDTYKGTFWLNRYILPEHELYKLRFEKETRKDFA